MHERFLFPSKHNDARPNGFLGFHFKIQIHHPSMFGFLYAPAPSCGNTAKSLYQSIFCGLSCRLHADYHAAARFLVNRDSTFLALCGSALAGGDTPMEQRTCCNPFAQKKQVSCHADSLSYAAAVTVSGLAMKLQDNSDDERGWRKHLPKFASTLLSPSIDKATAILNTSAFPTQNVIETLDQQSTIEKTKAGFMEASEPTAQSYGSIFSHLSKINQREECSSSLFRLGSSLGRLIYWKDAIDDWESDQKRGRFNPLQHQSAKELQPLVTHEFQQLQSATRDIPWLRHRDLIESVIGHTIHHHQEMADPTADTSKRKKKEKDSCWNYCDCCPDCSCGSCDCGSDCCSCDCG